MRTILITCILSFITAVGCSQNRINIDSLTFGVDLKENIDSVRTFNLIVFSNKIFSQSCFLLNHTITAKGKNIFFYIDSITIPNGGVTEVGPASAVINLHQLSNGIRTIYLIKNADTSVVKLGLSNSRITIKNSDKDFVTDMNVTINRTPELLPRDLQNIFQLALDLPGLQQFYHVDKDPGRKQIIFKHFNIIKGTNLIGVVKFGKQVELISEDEIKKKSIRNYFKVAYWVYQTNSFQLQLEYPFEGLLLSYRFKKVNQHWQIVSSELNER